MSWKNTSERFGRMSQLLHWLVFLLLLAQFAFIYVRWGVLGDDSAWHGTYMFLHKSIGPLLLLLMFLWLAWRLLNPKPSPLPHASSWQHRLSKWTQNLLIIGVLGMAISGILMSFTFGGDIDVFGLLTLTPPAFIPVNEALSGNMREAHAYFSYLVIACVGLHTAGALVHHFVYKDNVLRRMMP